ncbi:MAG: protein kinase domain-containing protein, partial [Planctomycetota bacterium]
MDTTCDLPTPDENDSPQASSAEAHYAELANLDTLPPSSSSVTLSEGFSPESGRYIEGPLLGEGGMARVVEGTDPVLDRTVALKILKPELAADEEHRQRFFQEAKVLAQLNHPGSIAVYGVGALEDGAPYLAMKKVEGETLDRFIYRA